MGNSKKIIESIPHELVEIIDKKFKLEGILSDIQYYYQDVQDYIDFEPAMFDLLEAKPDINKIVVSVVKQTDEQQPTACTSVKSLYDCQIATCAPPDVRPKNFPKRYVHPHWISGEAYPVFSTL